MSANLKRFIIVFVCMAFVTACSKKQVQALPVQTDPFACEKQKYEMVFAKMNERAKSEINSKQDSDFFIDLNKILEEEKKINSKDVSLFYLIDKQHTIGKDYVPEDLIDLKSNQYFNLNKKTLSLRPEAFVALEEMAKASLNDGIKLLVSSTYRSYEYQENLFNYWVKVDGLEEAERESARPGTSQHQLGTAVDFGSISDDFDETEMGKWVYKNASKYGWSLSFPKNYEDVTGYRWECWHFRFIGKNACDFQKKYFADVQQYMLEFLYLWKNN